MERYICGIDLGIDGGVCILSENELKVVDLIAMPTKTVKILNPKYKPPSAKPRKFKIENIKKPTKEFFNIREVDALALFNYLQTFNIKSAYIERVGSRPTDSKQSIVTFAKNCAYVTATLDIIQVPYKKIEPKAWQKELLGESTSDKQQMINYIAKHYPHIKLRATARARTDHNGMSDSLGIALYGAKLDDD